MNRPAFVLSTQQSAVYLADPKWQGWFRFHCPIVGGYDEAVPSFAKVAAWHPGALFYFSAYSIYDIAFQAAPKARKFYSDTDAGLILCDTAGAKLKIGYGPPFTEYAGDISNPAFIDKAISLIRLTIAAGKYAGFLFDNANLNPSFVNEAGQPVPNPYPLEFWQQAMLRYMRLVRAAFYSSVIVHNTPWRDTMPEQWPHLDYLNVEGGYGWCASQADAIRLSQTIAAVNKAGRKVIVYEKQKAQLGQTLPCFDAAAGPGDLLAVEDMMPDEWAL